MTSQVHPTAVIEPGASVGSGCAIGPYAYVGPDVVLEEKVTLKPHAYVTGDTYIGSGTTVFPFAVVGEVPQDLKFGGEKTALRIGRDNNIREHATIHIGTEGGGGVTRIGDGNLIMGGAHIAHDVQIGSGTVIVNHAAIGGHAVIGDGAIIGGLAGIHQWVRVGQGAMIGGLAKVVRDVIPYGIVEGENSALDGLNLVGLRRRKLDRADIRALRDAYDVLTSGEGTFSARAASLDPKAGTLVAELVEFLSAGSDRQFLTPRK